MIQPSQPKKKSVVRIGVTQFLYSLMALIFCDVLFVTFLTDLESDVWKIAVSLLTGALYFLIVYSAMNKFGIDDGNLVQFHHLPLHPARGVPACLIAALPYLAFNLWFASAYIPPEASNLKVLFNLVNSPLYWLTLLIPLDTTAHVWLVSLCLPILLVVITAIGYAFGRKGVSLLDKILYRRKDGGDHQPTDGQNYRI